MVDGFHDDTVSIYSIQESIDIEVTPVLRITNNFTAHMSSGSGKFGTILFTFCLSISLIPHINHQGHYSDELRCVYLQSRVFLSSEYSRVVHTKLLELDIKIK